jgi:ribosomal protein S17E
VAKAVGQFPPLCRQQNKIGEEYLSKLEYSYLQNKKLVEGSTSATASKVGTNYFRNL